MIRNRELSHHIYNLGAVRSGVVVVAVMVSYITFKNEFEASGVLLNDMIVNCNRNDYYQRGDDDTQAE